MAQTRNQRAVATALDRGPVTNSLIIAVLNQTVAGARQAFDALSGEVFGSVHNAQGQEAQFARSAMLGRMRQSSYAGIPGDLGALGFGGPALAYAAGDTSSADSAGAAYATKARARRTRPLARSDLLGAGSRRLGPCRQRWQRRLVAEPVRRLPLRRRCALRRDLARRLCGRLYALRSQCRCPREQRRHRQRPARRLCERPRRRLQRARRRLLFARQHRYQPRHCLPRLHRQGECALPRQCRAGVRRNRLRHGLRSVSRWSRSPGWLTCTCAMVRSSRAAALRRCRVQARTRTPAIPSSACALRPSCRWPMAQC